jgi:hypothetical protein
MNCPVSFYWKFKPQITSCLWLFSFVTDTVLSRKSVYLKAPWQLQSLLRFLFVLKNLVTEWHLISLCYWNRKHTDGHFRCLGFSRSAWKILWQYSYGAENVACAWLTAGRTSRSWSYGMTLCWLVIRCRRFGRYWSHPVTYSSVMFDSSDKKVGYHTFWTHFVFDGTRAQISVRRPVILRQQLFPRKCRNK